ncbi:MAG: hypothetical protein SNG96_00150 [Rikenellaceae bacterium]
MIVKIKSILLPFLAAIALYSTFSLIYFAPQLRGDTLSMHDVEQYDGMARDIIESRERTGVDPQWNGSMFGGMPAYMINVSYPSRLLRPVVSWMQNLMAEPASFILFAMAAMWLMLVMMGFNSWVAIVGGLMYGLSTYLFLIIGAGHIAKVWAMIYAPLMFGGVYFTLTRNMWIGAALTSLFASIQIGTNHPQITYYFLMVMAAFWLYRLVETARSGSGEIWRDFAKRTAILLLAGVVAVGASFSPLWYGYDHSTETTRGGSPLTQMGSESSSSGLDLEYATAWSYGRWESFNMFIPNFMGSDSANSFSEDGAVAQSLSPYGYSHIAQQLPTYWGKQPYTAGPTYIGAVVIFLAIFALFVSSKKQWIWIVAISALALLLSWGHNLMWFTELAFKILPGYNKFRAVSTTLAILEWTLPLLACYGVAALWSKEEHSPLTLRKGLIWSLSISGGVALLFALAAGAILSFGRSDALSLLVGAGFPDEIARRVASAMAQERGDILAADALRTLLFVALSGGVVYDSIAGWIKRGVMLALLGGLIVADIASVNWRYLSHDDFQAPSVTKVRPTAADTAIMGDKELGFRVFDVRRSPFNDATASNFHRSVGGYHGAKLARYQDIITYYLNQGDEEVLNMLNTKYTITRDSVVLRPQANGAAWFVSDLAVVNSPIEEIEALAQIDTKSMAVVESEFGLSSKSGLAAGTIEMVEYEPNYQRYESSSQGDGVAIFSEIYFDKGWSVYIDGQSVPYFRANYILRGVNIPQGEHVIEWKFRSPNWEKVEMVTLISNIIIILSLILALIYYARREKIKA